MEEKLLALREEALEQVGRAEDLKSLNEIRVTYLGKKGPLTEI